VLTVITILGISRQRQMSNCVVTYRTGCPSGSGRAGPRRPGLLRPGDGP